MWWRPKSDDGVDQDRPKFKANSWEERKALAQLQQQFPSRGKDAPSAAHVLACLRGRKYNIKQAAALVPELVALLRELDMGSRI